MPGKAVLFVPGKALGKFCVKNRNWGEQKFRRNKKLRLSDGVSRYNVLMMQCRI